jgi:hypothetical protein
MEWWNSEIIAFHAVIYQGGKWWQNQRSFSTPPQAFICPKGANPSFHFSNIPSFQSIVSQSERNFFTGFIVIILFKRD